MGWTRGMRADDRAGLAMLAMLAFVVQLAIPQGFMVASDHGQPAIVICTGHGPLLTAADGRGLPAKAPKTGAGAICAFAGHGGTPVIARGLAPVGVQFEQAAAGAPIFVASIPGRGLAAPPPPSQGPPNRIL